MKKALLSLAVLAASATAASAQSSNAFKANIFSPLVKTGSFFYERKVSETSSAQLGFAFTSWTPGDSKLSGIILTPEYRFYLSGTSMNGFYVGPYLRFQSMSLSTTYEDYDYVTDTTVEREAKGRLTTFGAGVAVGRQWMFKDRITIDPYLGLGYNGGSAKAEDGSNEDQLDAGTFSGFGLRPGFTVGIAF
ncbi:DUF3575 domain-containing protein [Solirubrum puertoriconensis]|uniref:DUF3575 domain-containing protein n=1 Tax=Solirubrum puertoriconensis TaxID=1751427 RepID=A0A9X0HIK5_SOLP1|nr:DUF3575 domain-containing protein [Solirubrum puertoriconensis]KUG06537.1 hypothetical protein ASU33_04085 [Solirubrum puertoriconensis]